MELKCPHCEPDVLGTLSLLGITHPEYSSLAASMDGTRKWFLCSNCNGVFCLDKVTGGWYLSAQTYTNFVQQGLIQDRLNT